MRFVLSECFGVFRMLLIAILLTASIPLDATAFENEPAGFRGIKWNTSLFQVPGLVLAEKDGEVRVYNKTNDALKLGGATLNGIHYTFYRDRFYSVNLTFNNPVHYDLLKQYTFEVYGPGQSESTMWRKTWWWTGENVNVRLDYSLLMREGTLCFTYLPLYQQFDADRLEAARGGLDAN
jgi:hypothetical protein